MSMIFCICRGGPRREEQSSSSVKFCGVPVLRSTPARKLVYIRNSVGVWSSIPAAPFLCDNFASMRRRGFTGLVPQTFACKGSARCGLLIRSRCRWRKYSTRQSCAGICIRNTAWFSEPGTTFLIANPRTSYRVVCSCSSPDSTP